MSKYDFIKDRNVVQTHNNLQLKYEVDYSGEIKTIDVKIYPYTVEEKLLIKTKTENIEQLQKTNPEQAEKLAEENLYESVLYILKKDDNGATIEHVRSMPMAWLNDLTFAALEAEGITREQLKEISEKKEADKL